MDPDAALDRIRKLAEDIDPDAPDADAVAELVETLAGLDAWLTKGGYRPRAWH